MNPVVHFEIPAKNMKRAKGFYETMFGWKIQAYADDYFMATTTPLDKNGRPKKPGAINGGLQRKDRSISSPRVVVSVPNLNRALKQAVARGGKVMQPKTEIPDMLWYAVILDTEGNELGLAEIMCSE